MNVMFLTSVLLVFVVLCTIELIREINNAFSPSLSEVPFIPAGNVFSVLAWALGAYICFVLIVEINR